MVFHTEVSRVVGAGHDRRAQFKEEGAFGQDNHVWVQSRDTSLALDVAGQPAHQGLTLLRRCSFSPGQNLGCFNLSKRKAGWPSQMM